MNGAGKQKIVPLFTCRITGEYPGKYSSYFQVKLFGGDLIILLNPFIHYLILVFKFLQAPKRNLDHWHFKNQNKLKPY